MGFPMSRVSRKDTSSNPIELERLLALSVMNHLAELLQNRWEHSLAFGVGIGVPRYYRGGDVPIFPERLPH